MVLWIIVTYDTRIFCYVIHLILLWANELIQGLACHIEATVFSEPGCYKEVFRYKKMAECKVDIIHKISSELIAKHKEEVAELRDDILSLHQTTNQLQAQLYDIKNQNYEYEARFNHISS